MASAQFTSSAPGSLEPVPVEDTGYTVVHNVRGSSGETLLAPSNNPVLQEEDKSAKFIVLPIGVHIHLTYHDLRSTQSELSNKESELEKKQKELEKAQDELKITKRKLLGQVQEELEEERKKVQEELEEERKKVLDKQEECEGLKQEIEDLKHKVKKLQSESRGICDDGTQIGRGGDGNVVYRVSDETLEEDVAVKRMLKSAVNKKSEYENLWKCAHRYILKTINFTGDDHFWYLRTELCHGSLFEYVEGSLLDGQLKEAQKDMLFNLELLRKIMEGVHYMHSMKLVHRDLKPQNILLLIEKGSDGFMVTPKIADFGLSKKIQGEMTVTTGVEGTRGWSAPEMITEDGDNGGTKRKRKADLTVDMFTMGCVVNFVLFGDHPFGGKYFRIANIVKYNPEQLNRTDFLTSKMIKKMISKDPKSRPSSAGEARTHCMFWDEEKQIRFFEAVRLHFPEKGSCKPLLYLDCRQTDFEREFPSEEYSPCSLASPLTISENCDVTPVVLPNWKLCEEFYLGGPKFKDSDGKSARQLIRYLRNRMTYSNDATAEVLREKMCDLKELKAKAAADVLCEAEESSNEEVSPDSNEETHDEQHDQEGPHRKLVLRYALAWFPNLLVHTYNVVETFFKDEKDYAEFFKPPEIDYSLTVPAYGL